MVPRSTIHKQKREFFLLLFLYYHIFLHPLRHFTKRRWGPWKAVARDAAEAWGGAEVPPLTARGSRSLLYRACGSESQERSGGQGQGRGWEAEGCGGEEEEEEDEGVPLATPERGARGRGRPIGEGWMIPGCGVQVQGGRRWRRGGATALQEG